MISLAMRSSVIPSYTSRCARCTLDFLVSPRSSKLKLHRPLSTQSPQRAGIAAAPIDFTYSEQAPAINPADIKNARVIPASPSFFSGKPDSTDHYLKLQGLLRRYQTLPTIGSDQVPRVTWLTMTQYRSLMLEDVGSVKYHRIIKILQRLNRIHPGVKPKELDAELDTYKRDIQHHTVIKTHKVIDEDGKTYGVGRRKSSSAKVYLVPGDGQVLVNGRTINLAFGRVVDRESALWPLKVTGRMDRYNVFALVSGGGTTGQAEAITLGAARALLVFEPALKPALRRGISTLSVILQYFRINADLVSSNF